MVCGVWFAMVESCVHNSLGVYATNKTHLYNLHIQTLHLWSLCAFVCIFM